MYHTVRNDPLIPLKNLRMESGNCLKLDGIQIGHHDEDWIVGLSHSCSVSSQHYIGWLKPAVLYLLSGYPNVIELPVHLIIYPCAL